MGFYLNKIKITSNIFSVTIKMTSFKEMVGSLHILLGLRVCVLSQSQQNFTPFQGGDPFVVPESISSSNGILDMTLDVDIGDISIDWLQLKRRLYNNSIPGPTIRIKPGDQWHLKLVNNLEEPDFNSDLTGVLQHPNTTNMHTHGLHISSEMPQDSQKVRIGPGGSYDYHYEINEEQPAGTYWYHPHHHGSNHFQTQSGMHGMIIVDDDENEEIASIEEVIVVTSIVPYMRDGPDHFIDAQEEIGDYFRLDADLEDWLMAEENHVIYMLVNGVLEPVMNMAAGTWKRFRVVNTGGLHALAVSVTGDDDSTPCQVYEIALDGIYLPEPRLAPLGRSLIAAGGRADLLIRCPSNGTYELISSFTPEDELSLGEHPHFDGLLMTLNVEGEAVDVDDYTLPQLPSLPSFFDDLTSIPEEEIAGRFAVEVTSSDTMNREDYRDKDYWRYKAEVGTIQEMILTNTQFEESHPIHMHINHMQVISYNEYTGPISDDEYPPNDDDEPNTNNIDERGEWALFDQTGDLCLYQHAAYRRELADIISFPEEALAFLGHEKPERQNGNGSIGYAKVGEWRDVIMVPPLSNITVRFRTHQYTGPVLIHCHLTGDADEGMMEVIGIVPKGADLTANVTSGGVYPWACMKNPPIGLPFKGSASSSYLSISTMVLSLIMYLLVTIMLEKTF